MGDLVPINNKEIEDVSKMQGRYDPYLSYHRSFLVHVYSYIFNWMDRPTTYEG